MKNSDMYRHGLIAMFTVCVVVLSGLGAQAQDDKKFGFKDEAGKYLDVLCDGKIVGRYMYAYDKSTPEKLNETYKPYLHVFDAEGKAPITNGAGGGEHPHHRGIMIGWKSILFNGKKHNFWGMNDGDQVHQKFLVQEADASHATFISLVNWIDKAGGTIIEEERTTTFRRASAPAYVMIDFSSKIKAPNGEIVLDGDPEHAGIQFRPANEIDRAKTIYTFPGENVDPRKDLDLTWVGESFTLNGKQYSAVQMNYPGNPSGAKTSAYRDYGRFGMFSKASIKSGESLTFKHRFIVAEGEMPSVEVIQKSCNEFTGKSDPVPKTTVKPADKPAPPKPKVAKPVKKDAKKPAAK
ncbi:MAG: PmoA family protein [Kiritimatiellae bacterium]|nr:PmoA family protein [Kiritimatiellia bacterium]MDD5522057.1 PmoA family protein [Kiritimatiellia bacterium]